MVLIFALVISGLTWRATQSAFNIYTTRNSQALAQQLAPILADYYASNQAWSGVTTFLQSSLPIFLADSNAASTNTGVPGSAGGQTQGRGLGQRRQSSLGGTGGAGWLLNQRIILSDESGVVIVDTASELLGKRIPVSQLEDAEAVMVDNVRVGSLLVTPNEFSGANNPAGQFLSSVNQSIILSAVIAGSLALLVGAGLFFQITSPLRKLNKAAGSIANGDLSQRVHVDSQDELGELGRTFNQMAENLERAETQRKHLIADVAHELRTPIAVIQANLEGILDGVLPLDFEQIASLHNETLLLNRLVADLRLVSLVESGQLKLERQELDIVSLLRQVVEPVQLQALQKDIRLTIEAEEGLPKVWIDPDRMAQVLSNLIGNALRYTPQSGQITVCAAFESGVNSAIRISVTDTGPGIEPTDLPFVFDRFYRADSSRTRANPGSGLGLAIVKQLVEAHGGRVEAVSPVFTNPGQPGFGTRISFTIQQALDRQTLKPISI